MTPKHMMRQTITIQNQTGTNDYSEPTYSAAVSTRARVELVNKSIQSATGEVIPIAAEIFTAADEAVDAGSKITYEGVNYRVIEFVKIPDGQGNYRMLEIKAAEWR